MYAIDEIWVHKMSMKIKLNSSESFDENYSLKMYRNHWIRWDCENCEGLGEKC